MADRAIREEGLPPMPEVLFYHLEHRPLEAVLPGLLERCVERGWRVAVQSPSEERLESLDAHLWTYRDDGFLPHGLGSDRDAAEQPVLLTSDDGRPNGARVRFLIDGAPFPDDASNYDRLVLLFDGSDPDALAAARAQWQAATAGGFETAYWQQNAQGKWERKN